MDLQELKQLVGRDGRIFSVVFTKRTDGSRRKMVARTGVRSGISGGGQVYDPETHGLLTVFDMQKRAYRTIPAESVEEVTVRGQKHVVVGRYQRNLLPEANRAIA